MDKKNDVTSGTELQATKFSNTELCLDEDQRKEAGCVVNKKIHRSEQASNLSNKNQMGQCTNKSVTQHIQHQETGYTNVTSYYQSKIQRTRRSMKQLKSKRSLLITTT